MYFIGGIKVMEKLDLELMKRYIKQGRTIDPHWIEVLINRVEDREARLIRCLRNSGKHESSKESLEKSKEYDFFYNEKSMWIEKKQEKHPKERGRDVMPANSGTPLSPFKNDPDRYPPKSKEDKFA
jgi:hypothetical protein